MWVYIARRLMWAPFLLLAVSFVTFTMGLVVPGDPIEARLGTKANPEAVERIREQEGLNDPILLQYYRYVTNAVRGDFGESLTRPGTTVWELLSKKIWISSQLSFASLLVSVGLGIPLGVYAAFKQGTWRDIATVSCTLVGMSMPVFLTAPGLIIVFGLWMGILPVQGWGGFLDLHIVLPSVAMGIPGIAIVARLTRSSTLEVITQDYVRTARAKGLPEGTIRTRHVLRNALIPVVTALGMSLAGLLVSSVIVERFFGIPGAGQLAIESFFSRDYPVITALVLLGGTAFFLANLLVDLAYPLLDPRIRLDGNSTNAG
jgi:peptide/nickel transport system permease protein